MLERKLWLWIVLLTLLVASCGQASPVWPGGYSSSPTQEPSPSTPTVTPEQPQTPTPLVVQPTPYMPEGVLPDRFPVLIYAVQRPQEPVQIWMLHYEEGLLREELLLNLDPLVLESEINGSPYVGYLWPRGLVPSSDGRYVAVNLEAYTGVGSHLIVELDGQEVHMPPAPVEGDVQGFLLAWVPNSDRFVWAGSDGANWGTLAIDGSGYVRFPVHDVLDVALTPTGEEVIFSKMPMDGIWAGTIDVDGSDPTPFLLAEPLPGGYVRNLSLSPDGWACAFTREHNVSYHGAGQIWIMDADGSNQGSLGPSDTYDFDLTWSPDGSTIAFVRWDDPETQILPRDLSEQISSLWLIEVANGQEHLLLSSEGEYAHWSPKWLSDGSGLIFLSNRGGEVNIWFVRADGTGLQQMTHQGGLCSEIVVLPK